MSSPFQKKLTKQKQRRKGRKTRSSNTDDLAFWTTRGWPSATLNGKDSTPSVPNIENKKKPKERSEEIGGWSELWERSMQRSAVHDEFSVKSIVISVVIGIVIATLAVAGSVLIANKIFHSEEERKNNQQKEMKSESLEMGGWR
jgi:hypothetical protein